MILALLLLVPTFAGLACWVVPRPARRVLLPATAVLHLVLTFLAAGSLEEPGLAWLALDAPGMVFLGLTSALFAVASFYAVGYLRREANGSREDMMEGLLFRNAPEATFTGCLLLFLATMTLVTVSQHLGVLWIAIEATTLASAPLLYFHRHHRSLEATWKYLLLCSVGIALALLGTFFWIGAGGTLHLGKLMDLAPRLDPVWLRLGFLLVVVGYGTKMGLAPMHTWLPDTHSEAPSVVSALLSGALLNCAFLGILRALEVMRAAGQAEFGHQVLVLLGLLSLAVSAAFLLNQPDFKRLLAYSSVEHMGILALGVGLGGPGVFGALLHAVNHSLAKGAMFMLAGNLMEAFRTRAVAEVRGALRVTPLTGALWLAGALALTGSPPFGLFHSELTVLRAALTLSPGVAALYLTCLAMVFVGVMTAALGMTRGPATLAPFPERRISVVPPLVLLALVLALGLVVPGPLTDLLTRAAAEVGGR